MHRTLAFCLYKYFPYGGQQRDMLRIALACRKHGFTIDVYTTSWQGEAPDYLRRHIRSPRGLSNHTRMKHYHAWVAEEMARNPADCVIGFNKMPGLDIYYAADGCFQAKALEGHSRLYRLGPRYRRYQAFEDAVFRADAGTHILMLSKIQEALYVRHYGTPPERLHFLPPNVARDRFAGPDAPDIRRAFRTQAGLGPQDNLLVQVGSGFRTKGLDRSIRAIANLPGPLLAKTRLYVIGSDRTRPYVRLARRLGVGERVRFLGPRDDVPRILLGADLLLHPAYNENTGTVLLEALACGLAVIASGVCGYAHYIDKARAGWVIPQPFDQASFSHTVRTALEQKDLHEIGNRGRVFAQCHDLCGMVDAAVEVISRIAQEAGTRRDTSCKQS